MRGEIESGDVLVIRYEGPKGGPGMREMLGVTSALVGQGHVRTWCCSPMAASPAPAGGSASATRPRGDGGGPIAILQDGDTVTVDIPNRDLSVYAVRRRDQAALEPLEGAGAEVHHRRARRSTRRSCRRPALAPSPASVRRPDAASGSSGRGLVPRQRPSTLTDWMHSCNPGIRASESAWILRFMRSLGICVRSRSRYGTDNASSPLLILLMRPSRCLRHFPRVIVSRFTPSASCQITFTYSWNLQTPVTSSHSMDSSRILLSGKPGNSVCMAPFGSTASGTTSYGRTKISRWLPTTYARTRCARGSSMSLATTRSAVP